MGRAALDPSPVSVYLPLGRFLLCPSFQFLCYLCQLKLYVGITEASLLGILSLVFITVFVRLSLGSFVWWKHMLMMIVLTDFVLNSPGLGVGCYSSGRLLGWYHCVVELSSWPGYSYCSAS